MINQNKEIDKLENKLYLIDPTQPKLTTKL